MYPCLLVCLTAQTQSQFLPTYLDCYLYIFIIVFFYNHFKLVILLYKKMTKQIIYKQYKRNLINNLIGYRLSSMKWEIYSCIYILLIRFLYQFVLFRSEINVTSRLNGQLGRNRTVYSRFIGIQTSLKTYLIISVSTKSSESLHLMFAVFIQ